MLCCLLCLGLWVALASPGCQRAQDRPAQDSAAQDGSGMPASLCAALRSSTCRVNLSGRRSRNLSPAERDAFAKLLEESWSAAKTNVPAGSSAPGTPLPQGAWPAPDRVVDIFVTPAAGAEKPLAQLLVFENPGHAQLALLGAGSYTLPYEKINGWLKQVSERDG
jgi:hypothetical protein